MSRDGWNPRLFLLVALIFIVISRVALIEATPTAANDFDIAIYQSSGKLVLAGVNPYDFNDQPQVRELVRREMSAVNAYDTATQERWDLFVAANLPASTMLYALFEFVSGGSRWIWRLLFIGGDISILLGAYALFTAFWGAPRKRWDQAAIFSIACIYPSLIVSGTIIPEDKQYQTALVLFAAAFLSKQGVAGKARDIVTGLTLSLSVLFKLFGVFLLPLFLVRYWKGSFKAFLRASIAGLIPLALSFILFGAYFIETIGARGGNDSFGVAQHSSPWVLLAALGNSNVLGLRILLTIGLVAVTMWLLARRRIDVLNACAALMVVFACVWLVGADINRMNMAMMFAVPALASVSVWAFRGAAIGNLGIQAIGYPVLYLLMGRDREPVQAALTWAFLVVYFFALFRMRHDTAEETVGNPAQALGEGS